LPPLPRPIAVGPPEHRQAIAAGVLSTLQLDLKDARADRERRIKQFLCRGESQLAGPIDPEAAACEPFVREAVCALPEDPVGDVVAGVIGSVFRLAGHEADVVAAGCRIGHTLGRLMNLSDALEDYFDDLKAGRPNPLASEAIEQPLDDHSVECELHGIIETLDSLVRGLPLKRHQEFLDTLVNVHARARVDAALARFRARAAARGLASPRERIGPAAVLQGELSSV
jgi:hypothetical protein